MKIKCLGGFREVGKSGVLLETKKENILFDYGLEVEDGLPPLKPNKKVHSILMSHAHLDHVGCAPMIYRNGRPKMYSTAPTFDQGHLNLKDSMKIARIRGLRKLYNKDDLNKLMKNEINVTYGQQFETKESIVDVFDAGHIPGSCAFLVESQGKTILYTGDFNTAKTRLLDGSKIDATDIDVLVTESTYAAKEHTDRKATEKELSDIIEGTIANDGVVLIPSFAIGRSAEVLLTLDALKKKYPIHLDGMAVSATRIAMKYPEFLRDHKKLKKAFKNVNIIGGPLERKKAVKQPGIIVTTSGMMEGGPIIQYMKYLYNNPQSSLVFVGFLIPKTAGRYLLNTGRFVNEDIDLKVKMNIHSLDFSAHIGRNDLFKFVQKTNPKKIICMHGDHCQRFAMELRGRGYDAIAPNNGDSIKLD